MMGFCNKDVEVFFLQRNLVFWMLLQGIKGYEGLFKTFLITKTSRDTWRFCSVSIWFCIVKRGESPLTPSLEHTRRKWDKHVYASDIPDYFEAPQASTTTQKNKK